MAYPDTNKAQKKAAAYDYGQEGNGWTVADAINNASPENSNTGSQSEEWDTPTAQPAQATVASSEPQAGFRKTESIGKRVTEHDPRSSVNNSSTVTTSEEKVNLTPEQIQAMAMPMQTYERREYSPTPTLRRLMDLRNKREEQLRQNNMSDTERERRKAKYLAWTNLFNSLGSVAGMGYAPVAQQDNSRVIESFKRLDALRKENADIINDPYISWVDKLNLTQELQHEAQEINRELQINKYNQDAIKNNQNLLLKTAGKTKVSASQTRGNTNASGYRSVSDYSTIKDSNTKPFMEIGSNVNYPITESMAITLYDDVVHLIRSDVSNNERVKENGVEYYVSPNYGIKVPKSNMDNVIGSLVSIKNRINNGQIDPATKNGEIKNLLLSVNSISGGDLERVARGISGDDATYEQMPQYVGPIDAEEWK